MMKMIGLSLLFIVGLTACSPRIGVGGGGVVASSDGMTASEVVADSETGIHGSVTMGTDIRL
ncbi:MAG: hypothetical protein KC427_00175 [Sulfurovum sp.]|uniref:hypothetical protein n=1 Tax=Sulfurovum sp. TaxID=1969726 RepID=UPI0028681CB7|nr:hypothetical protein [Sulfurovum sp.]MCO4844413.1 hypothetical protein [Sulfurovum sp.]